MEEFSLSCFKILLSLTFLIFLMYKILMNLFYSDQKSKSPMPPGTKGLPFIGETLQFMAALKSDKGFYEFVRNRRLRYGNSFRTNLFGKTQVFLSSTESVKAILSSESGKFTKRYIKSVGEMIGKQSILCASQQHHKLIRGRLSSLFTGNYLSVFVKLFDCLVVDNLKSWEHRSDCVVVLDEALKIACKAMCKMVMSLESEYELDVLHKEVAIVCKALLAFPIKIPGTRYYKGLQARKKIMCTIEKEISDRRRGLVGQHDDLLKRLLDLYDPISHDWANRQTLVDGEIKDNMLTIIIAGQDTTASAITWMVKYLDDNKDVLLKLRNELLQLSRKSPRNDVLSLEDLNDMPYASKVVKESLRLASVVAWFPRISLGDTEIEGYGIKKGWIVNIDAKQVHLDPTVYNDPNAFNPSRCEDEPKPYSYLAFGMGARTCLGTNMAKAMMLVFLYRLTTTYRWKVMDPDSSIEKWAMFSRLKSGCPVTVKRISNDYHYLLNSSS